MANGLARGIDPAFFKHLVLRQIRQDYLENLTGFAWLVLQPLLLLAVYAFVFTQIFRARFSADSEISFVAYLAVAFWPWTAFSESILKASNAITEHSALVTKVAFANEQLPLATVTATFIMHGAGYLAVLLFLQIFGTDIHWITLPAVFMLYLMMWALACAISLFTASTQVFIKDLAQILPPLMTFWFFTTPILYSITMLPAPLAKAMAFNPMTWFVVEFRELLLFGNFQPGWIALAMIAGIVVLYFLGLAWFRRFSGHFEDFL